MSIRTERVSEEIHKILSSKLVRGLRDPVPGFVTISHVEVTSDFSSAKVYVSVFGTDAEKRGALEVLNENRGLLRSEVGRNVRLRNTPALQFILDESAERGARVLDLLQHESAEIAERARLRDGGAAAAAPAVKAVEAPVDAPAKKAAPRTGSKPARGKK